MLSAADTLFCSMSVSQPASALNKFFAKGQINSATWSIANGWLKESAPEEVK